MTARPLLKNTHRWVIKIGSSLLTNNGKELDIAAIRLWCKQIAELRKMGVEVALVSSGAVAAGMSRLGWPQRPKAIHQLQAAAAVGQMELVQTYEQIYQQFGLHTAQILLDHDDLSNRHRYLNARSTMLTLIELGVIPIINENDTVVTDEIRFGDNDTLAALVTNLIEADVLVILTDQNGMYRRDPRIYHESEVINEISALDESLQSMAGNSSGPLGLGGMVTKVRAARLAARSGAHTLIAGGRTNDVLLRLRAGEQLGTLLVAEQQPQTARKRWLGGQLQTRGTLVLDNGAVKALTEKGRSLLAIGVTEVAGEFTRGDMVVCSNDQGHEIARGLINYSSSETQKIIGMASERFEELLGYKDDNVLIHRNNLVLV